MALMSTLYLVLGGLALLCVGVGGAFLYFREYEWEPEPVTVDDLIVDQGDVVEFSPPEQTGSLLDTVRLYRHLRRQRKMAKKGYVKWITIGSNFNQPKWVKPKREGTGIPRYMDDGDPYYFPKEAMVVDATTGAWVAMHREGDADPINLRDSDMPAIETDKVNTVINLEAESEAPGWLSGLDITPQKILWGGIAVILAYGLIGGM